MILLCHLGYCTATVFSKNSKYLVRMTTSCFIKCSSHQKLRIVEDISNGPELFVYGLVLSVNLLLIAFYFGQTSYRNPV